MAMAVAARGAVSIVAATLQGRMQFRLEHLLDVRLACDDLVAVEGHPRIAHHRRRAGRVMTDAATPVELMTIAGSRLLRDGRVVFAGVGSPLEASVLAKRLHAPSLTIVLEGGSIGPRMLPGRLPVSTNEMRAAHDAFMLTSINDLFLYGQRGCYDYGFIGAGQSLDPGVYKATSSLDVGGALTLNAHGNAGAVFIFQVSATAGGADSQQAGRGHHRPGPARVRRADGPAAARRPAAGGQRSRRARQYGL